MEHRTGANESSNVPSASSNSMPSVLFREIHKNAFLKRHSSDRRTGFPRKSERVWVVFCVHDDVEPFLEIYPDQKVALTHKPEWFASLSTALHVSPTICGHEDEFEFAVTLSFQVVRLAAPTWEAMMEWVETIRNKLRELKVLCPKENVYSKMPEPKQQLLPTRDPNSPLPLPPEGPSTLLPGVELVHLQSRNSSSSSDNGESGRHQRDGGHNRNNVIQERQANKRQRDKRPQIPELPQTSSDSPTPSTSKGNAQETLEEANGEKQGNPNAALLKHKSRIHKTSPAAPQSSSSASHISSSSNVTVIEVSLPSSNEHRLGSEGDSLISSNEGVCDNDDLDDVFHATSVTASHKPETKITATDSNEEEAHYEHVFLLNIPVTKPQVPPAKTQNLKSSEPVVSKMLKQHSTSVLINSNSSSIPVSSSLSESVPGPSNSLASGVSDVHVECPTNSDIVNTDKRDSVIAIQIQSSFEKVNISGNPVSKIPNKVHAKPKSPYILETKPFSNESTSEVNHHQHNVIVEEDEETREKIDKSENNAPVYSQVKKIPKVKVKSADLRNPVTGSGSPVLPRRKVNGEIESDNSSSSDAVGKTPMCQIVAVSSNKVPPPSQRVVGGNKISGSVNVTVVKDSPRSYVGHPSSSSSPSVGMDAVPSASFTSAEQTSNNAKPSATKKDFHSNGITKSEVEPIAATIPPAVGVITVEDIPLIGGHQRRRRRSSSSDPVPPAPVSSSRVIGGADRIRINVPQMNQLTREDHRGESEPGSNSRSPVTDQIVQINVTPQSSRLTLREQQVLQLKKEMLHPGGVRLQLRRKDCIGSIALVDVHNGVWVAGWKQKERPLLYNALHIGDQLVSVSDMVVRTAADAQKLIRSSTNFHIEFIIRRVPYGNVFALQRTAEGQPLGIVQEGSTAEIREIVPNSLAARQGLTSKTPSSDGLSLTTWFITEINGRPLNLFFKDCEVRDRLNAVGKEISILVQPHDFVKQLKKQLKNLRGYKDYIVQ